MTSVAVLTLCRDRLEFTKHCFRTLRENAGCEYAHFVLDQGSTDGTGEWVLGQDFAGVILSPDNVGIHRGHNKLLDMAFACDDFDVVCTFDNDCEVTMPGTLHAAAKVAALGSWIVSPTVLGLNHPPQPGGEYVVAGERIGVYWEMGGIFRVMPGEFAKDFKFNEERPLWGKDEVDVGAAARERGYGSGYLLDWHVWHYRSTQGQQAEQPEYFARKFAEMR